MRFRIRLKDISAFLVDGDYDWRKQYNVNPETGRLHVVNDHVLYQPDSVESLKNRGDKDTGASEGKRDDDGGLFFLPMLEKTGITVALEQVTPINICWTWTLFAIDCVLFLVVV